MKSTVAFRQLLDQLYEEELAMMAAVENPLVPDSVAGLICPNCGEMAANVQKVNDAEVELSDGGAGGSDNTVIDDLGELLDMAVCAACGAEFAPPPASPAKEVIGAVLGERQRVLRRLDHVPLHEAVAMAHILSR